MEITYFVHLNVATSIHVNHDCPSDILYPCVISVMNAMGGNVASVTYCRQSVKTRPRTTRIKLERLGDM